MMLFRQINTVELQEPTEARTYVHILSGLQKNGSERFEIEGRFFFEPLKLFRVSYDEELTKMYVAEERNINMSSIVRTVGYNQSLNHFH